MKAFSCLIGAVLVALTAGAFASTYKIKIQGNASMEVVNPGSQSFFLRGPAKGVTLDGTVFSNSAVPTIISGSETGTVTDSRLGEQDFYFNLKNASDKFSIRDIGPGCEVHIQYDDGVVVHAMVENDHGYVCKSHNVQVEPSIYGALVTYQ